MLGEAVVGCIVGVLARYVVPDSKGIGGDTLIGVVGGLFGGFLYKIGTKLPFPDFDAWSLVCAAIGAFVLILIVRAAGSRRTIA